MDCLKCIFRRFWFSTYIFMNYPFSSIASMEVVFIKDGDKKYKTFYKQLRKLPLNEQLATINYILLSNTEKIFMNPTVAQKFMKNDALLDVCTKSPDCFTDIFTINPIGQAIKEFSLSQRNSIPNFLNQEFAL